MGDPSLMTDDLVELHGRCGRRLAALAGVPVDKVRAAFYYVRDDATVRPADLLDEAGLAALIESIPVG